MKPCRSSVGTCRNSIPGLGERLDIVAAFEATIDDSRDAALLEMLDLSASEGATDSQLRRDLGIVELLGLQVGQPLHEARQHAQPDPPQRRVIALVDFRAVIGYGTGALSVAGDPPAAYQMPSSALASSEAMMRGSQRGVHTRLMSTSLTAGKRLVRTACAWVLITGPSGQAGVVSVMSMRTFFESSSTWTP